jgi:hypothetical protein
MLPAAPGVLELRIMAHPLRAFSIIFALALITRVVVVCLFADTNPATANLWEYGPMARLALERGQIAYCVVAADGSEFVYPSAFVAPMAIFAWMGLFSLLGVTPAALVTMLVINVLCGTAVVVMTMRIAARLFGSPAIALVAGALLALHPVWVFSASTYHGLNLYLLLLLIVADLCLRQGARSILYFACAGLVTGVAILTRTEYLFLGFALLAGSWLAHRRWLCLFASLACAGLVVLPWTIRNHRTFDRLIPVANSTGFNLFKGFNPMANGSGRWIDVNPVRARLLADQLAAVPLDDRYESATDDVYKAAALQFMRENPVQSFVVLPLKKLLLFWTFDFHDATTHQVLYQIAFWPMAILSLAGLIAALRRGAFNHPAHRTVLLLFAAQSLVVAAYAVHARYRLNVEPFLAAYSAAGLLAWEGRFAATLRKEPAA